MLNSLIGSTDMRRSVETIWHRDKSAFNVMDMLIAVRSDGKKKILDSLGRCVALERCSSRLMESWSSSIILA